MSTIAKYEALVKATDGSATGCYQLTVGSLAMRTEAWEEKEAKQWLPVIRRACNSHSALVAALTKLCDQTEHIVRNILTDTQLDTRLSCGRTVRQWRRELAKARALLARVK